jgi:hypothetical protein
VKIEEFDIKEGLRQGDMLSTILFNLALEKVMTDERGGHSKSGRNTI